MKKKNIIGIIAGILLFIITTIFIVILKKIDVIPDKYFMLLVATCYIVTIITDVFLFISSDNIVFKLFKGLAYIVTILMIVGYSCGIYYLNKTTHFMNNLNTIKKEITSYYIIVMKESKYDEISDLYGKNLTYYEGTSQEVLSKIRLELNYSTVKNIDSLKDRLYTAKTDSILVSDLIKEDLEEKYTDFSERTRVLKTIDITKDVEDITKKVSIKNTSFNVLISGMDSYGTINKTTRNDVNMIATVNPNTNKVLLTSIPRDYYVQLHGKTGYKDKLTHAGIYGINTVVQTIEDLFGIDINYYVRVNFTTVESLVNTIGPIEIYSDKAMSLDGCKYVVGTNTVNGKCALRFARERHSYIDGDRHRGRNQQEVIKAIFNKASNAPTLLSEYTNILNVLDGKFATNMDMSEVLNLVKYEMNDLKDYEIISIQVDGIGAMGKTYSYPYEDLWIMIPDENTINDAKDKITKILNNEKIKG